MTNKFIFLTIMTVIFFGNLVGCGDKSSEPNKQSDSNGLAIVSIDGNEYKMSFVTCQPPHSETKAYTVMALEVENDITAGASFRSFGSPQKSTIAFAPKPNMDSNGYNLTPNYSSKGAVDFKDNTYAFSGKFDKVLNSKITETLDGTVKVTCP